MIQIPASFDIQGHRGCRGLLPENTITAFTKALLLGVTTLEFDLVISKDKQVVVSHDTFFHHEITTMVDGEDVTESNQRQFNLYKMNYADIKEIDVGMKRHPRFKSQVKIPAGKPLLKELIETSERISSKILFNGEIKSTVEGDGMDHPHIPEFCDLVVAQIKKAHIANRFTIQSFDTRALEYMHKMYPEIQLSYLVETKGTLEKHLKALTFTPAIYSPDYTLLTKKDVDAAHALGIRVIPWTVNTKEEIETLIKMGVDGLITDYPNLFFE
ncbi:MAG TPA: glycerophosphodiester phosphodiesterase [Cytophaga sp.]|jgi:glycerophosphoryl diester phosphodiesterase|nr:glycerophosphodiester phosphodiesterase [Cytophaga sp.]